MKHSLVSALVLGLAVTTGVVAQTAGTSGAAGSTGAPSNPTTMPRSAPSASLTMGSTPGTPSNAMPSPDRSAANANTRAPAGGANSFTESQAKSRMEDQGFGQITDLKKDDKGIWTGRATKNGQSVTVMLDYQGNIVTR